MIDIHYCLRGFHVGRVCLCLRGPLADLLNFGCVTVNLLVLGVSCCGGILI